MRQGVVFSPNFKAGYDITKKVNVGLEYYVTLAAGKLRSAARAATADRSVRRLESIAPMGVQLRGWRGRHDSRMTNGLDLGIEEHLVLTMPQKAAPRQPIEDVGVFLKQCT